MNDPKPPDAGGTVFIEGFYDWGPGVVLAADCLGRPYQTALAGRRLIVTIPSFDGTAVVEPPLLYQRPEQWVDVDPPNPWGDLRSWNNAEDGSPIPVTVCVKRVRILLWINETEASNAGLGPQLDEELSPWWDALSAWIEVVTGQDLANPGDRRPKQPQTFHLWGGNSDGTMRPLSMLFHAKLFPHTEVLTPRGLHRCLFAVASGHIPAPERLHLCDARSLHNDGQWRRAVIDAATAAEVAITSWLDNRLEHCRTTSEDRAVGHIADSRPTAPPLHPARRRTSERLRQPRCETTKQRCASRHGPQWGAISGGNRCNLGIA
jgi:hypothetical protein